MAAKPKPVDWTTVELEYRAGILTTSAIGKKQGISHTAVQKRAKAAGWTRDLSKRIEAAREAKVSRAMVSPKVAEQKKATEEAVVQATANTQTAIILSEQEDIKSARRIVRGLFTELRAAQRKHDLAARAVIAQRLSSAMTSLIDKERQAFGIDRGGERKSLAEWLDAA